MEEGASLQSLHVKHQMYLSLFLLKSDKTRLTGSNISVKFTDKFMNAVDNDKTLNFAGQYQKNMQTEMRITPDRFIRNKVKS